jgi:hypothetical protein
MTGAKTAEGCESRAVEAAEEEELLLEEIVSELPGKPEATTRSQGPQVLAAPPATPVEVARLEAELRDACNRGEVARLALRLARRYARAAALFVVHRGVVAGLRGEADGLERSIEGIMVPTDGESLFAGPVSSGETLRCGTTSRPMDARILRAMGRGDARDRIVVPVSIGGRVVNLLYADNGPEALGATSIAALQALAACVAAVYERLIIECKRAPASAVGEGRRSDDAAR